ncbi:MAG: cbb3-type cytochrome c oxidase subunit II [Verrucomicrobia bacterium]|nr:cbb3-type cytochrome c oxidase subunit II [Verrucomicrobiota bacterium]MDA1004987.1 cbb3-type cytochrome c oxidase subunit II [Verrucomicrobiota bacterium]
MTFRTFSLGLLGTFSLPWLLIVVVPYATMQRIQSVEFNEDDDGRTGPYVPARPGRVTDGAAVYAANGCYTCHTQLIRPTYAGTDMWREDWAGVHVAADNIDTRRETSVFDFNGEAFAQIGLTRTGPDLSNVGHRAESYVKGTETTPEEWFLMHLYNPRGDFEYWSSCPSNGHLFKVQKKEGQGSGEALAVKARKGKEVVPTAAARALASYLYSLQKDDQVPYSLNYRPDKKRAIEQ